MRRFTIRDLLWLTVVVALGVGWATGHFRSANRRLELRAQAMQKVLEDDGWIVEHDGWSVTVHKEHGRAYQFESVPPPTSFGIENDFSGSLSEGQRQFVPPAFRNAYCIESAREISAAELAQLKQLKQEVGRETVAVGTFVALRDYRCVQFPGGVSGDMIVIERYLVRDP